MRLLFGMILGALLTVGVAYVSDTWSSGPATTNGSVPGATDHRPMVNWDIVGDNLRIASQRAREAWSTLSHKVAG